MTLIGRLAVAIPSDGRLLATPSARTSRMAKTSNALKILDRAIGDDAELRRMVAREVINSQVAQLVFDARSRAGLSQGQLAKLARTKPSVIARIEDADFRGDSLVMLQRIAAALHEKIEIRLAPATASTM